MRVPIRISVIVFRRIREENVKETEEKGKERKSQRMQSEFRVSALERRYLTIGELDMSKIGNSDTTSVPAIRENRDGRCGVELYWLMVLIGTLLRLN